MTRKILTGLILFLLFACQSESKNQSDKIVVGAERMSEYLDILKGKSIGLVVNQSSLVGTTHLVDTLLSEGINISKIFTPEHGFRGDKDAGELVNDDDAESTGFTIISLYGKNKKPTPEALSGIDIMVFDLQDVGVRFYTYASTMHLVMEACAQNNIPMILLDRPNPNGHYIDGPILDPQFRSFVGMHEIPVVHGLTLGELAQMINGEKWLEGGVQTALQVITLENYNHQTSYSLPIKPSPNLPNDQSIAWYPSLCFFEGTVISIGRGTVFPFQVAGYTDPEFGTFTFTPESIEGMASNPKLLGKQCFGVDLRNSVPPSKLDLSYLIHYYNLFENKEKYFISYFNTLAGTDQLRIQIEQGMSEEEIRKSWQQGLDDYRIKRKIYLLYP